MAAELGFLSAEIGALVEAFSDLGEVALNGL